LVSIIDDAAAYELCSAYIAAQPQAHTAQLTTLFASSNLSMAQKQLMGIGGLRL
jgi:hypothetical protein